MPDWDEEYQPTHNQPYPNDSTRVPLLHNAARLGHGWGHLPLDILDEQAHRVTACPHKPPGLLTDVAQADQEDAPGMGSDMTEPTFRQEARASLTFGVGSHCSELACEHVGTNLHASEVSFDSKWSVAHVLHKDPSA